MKKKGNVLNLITHYENKFNEIHSRKYRNINGQFFTPQNISEEMVDFTLSKFENKEIKFLEPAFGLGSLVNSVKKSKYYNNNLKNKFIGIEKSRELHEYNLKIWDDVELVNCSFENAYINRRFNLVITNPPYIRHHHLSADKKRELQNMVYEETNYWVPATAGMYVYFILLAHKYLEKDAISSWLIPVEFLFTKYGKVLRQYLSNKVTLIKIHKYDTEASRFKDALVSSCIVIFKNKEPNSETVVNVSLGDSIWSKKHQFNLKNDVLKSSDRWSNLFIENVNNDNIEKIGDFFYTRRGIATGYNKFFILSKEEVKDLELPDNYYKPLIPASKYLDDNIVLSDELGNPLLNKQLFLLDTDESKEVIKKEAPKLFDKIKKAEENDINKKYLLSKRKIWYKIENREAAPFLINYMARKKENNENPYRIIWNKSKGIVTNNYIMLYPKGPLKDLLQKKPELYEEVFHLLNSIDLLNYLEHGREYGGGLKKIEPKEILNLKIKGLSDILLDNI